MDTTIADAVCAYDSPKLACVVFPTAETLKQLDALACRKDKVKGGLTIIVNPQWTTRGSQLISDFGIGPWRAANEAKAGSFKRAFCLRSVRIRGDEARVWYSRAAELDFKAGKRAAAAPRRWRRCWRATARSGRSTCPPTGLVRGGFGAVFRFFPFVCDVGKNKLRKKGGLTFFSLPPFPSLSLSLEPSHRPGDAGAAAIAEALKTNTTLERLELSGNAVDAAGAAALAEALASSSSLKVLHLSDNYVGAAGALSLAAALRQEPVAGRAQGVLWKKGVERARR